MDTPERAEIIAESFINGNFSWVKEQLRDKTTLTFMVLDVLMESYPDKVKQFSNLVRS